MRKSVVFIGVVCLICLISTSAFDNLKDSSADDVLALRQGKQYRSEWSKGDIQFYDDVPEFASLSPAEKLLLADSPYEAFESLPPEDKRKGFVSHGGLLMDTPWIDLVLDWTQAYCWDYSQLPDRLRYRDLNELYDLRLAHVRTDSGDRSALLLGKQCVLNSLRSPLTGNYPRLDAKEFSAGDLYVQLLTEEETTHYADLLSIDTGNRESLSAGAVYFRLYGENEVIAQGIRW